MSISFFIVFFCWLIIMFIGIWLEFENNKLFYKNLEQRYKTEMQSLVYFSKLYKIQAIISTDEESKEPAVFTLDKIKEVIANKDQ